MVGHSVVRSVFPSACLVLSILCTVCKRMFEDTHHCYCPYALQCSVHCFWVLPLNSVPTRLFGSFVTIVNTRDKYFKQATWSDLPPKWENICVVKRDLILGNNDNFKAHISFFSSLTQLLVRTKHVLIVQAGGEIRMGRNSPFAVWPKPIDDWTYRRRDSVDTAALVGRCADACGTQFLRQGFLSFEVWLRINDTVLCASCSTLQSCCRVCSGSIALGVVMSMAVFAVDVSLVGGQHVLKRTLEVYYKYSSATLFRDDCLFFLYDMQPSSLGAMNL